jgi:hypothetical protein
MSTTSSQSEEVTTPRASVELGVSELNGMIWDFETNALGLDDVTIKEKVDEFLTECSRIMGLIFQSDMWRHERHMAVDSIEDNNADSVVPSTSLAGHNTIIEKHPLVYNPEQISETLADVFFDQPRAKKAFKDAKPDIMNSIEEKCSPFQRYQLRDGDLYFTLVGEMEAKHKAHLDHLFMGNEQETHHFVRTLAMKVYYRLAAMVGSIVLEQYGVSSPQSTASP